MEKENIKIDSQLLHNDNTEMCVLNQLSISTLQQVQEAIEFGLCSDCFYNSKNKEVFQAIESLCKNGEEPNIMSILHYSNKEGKNIEPADIIEIQQHRYVSQLALYQTGGIPMLMDMATKRKTWNIAKTIEHNSLSLVNDIDSTISKAIDDLKNARITGEDHNTVSMQETINDIYKIVDGNINGTNQKLSTITGFPFIDDRGGFRGGNLIVIAGATSMGKTSFADSIVLNAIENDSKIAFYTLEMTKEELTARFLSCFIKIDSNKILTGVLNSEELKRFDAGVGDIYNMAQNLFFDHKSSASIDHIINTIRLQKAKNNINGVVVDFLQRLHGIERGQTKEQFMGMCAQRLKDIAIELDIWVVVLSQVNRDPNNPLPSLDRLRDSGQIAEACDISMMIYRPQYYNEREGKDLSYPAPYENVNTEGTAMIIVQKGRSIGTGSFICGFDSSTTHFYPLNSLPIKNRTINSKEINAGIPLTPF